MKYPKMTAPKIKALLTIPSTENDNFNKIVEITKPEFLMIL